MNLMADPRIMKLMQDERVMRALMATMSVPGKMQSFAHEHIERVVKAMALATADDVQDLKRTVRNLEEQVAKLEHARRAEAGKKNDPRGQA